MKKLNEVRNDVRKIKFVIGILSIGWLAFTLITGIYYSKTSSNIERKTNDTTANYFYIKMIVKCPICDKKIREGQTATFLSYGDRLLMIHTKCLELPR